MDKYVYLFELDSVRKTDEEIICGQRALYDEIIKNRNIVVMTFNQFVDSRAFFSLLDNEDYFNSILELFNKGYIRISQYGNIRSIAQYLLNALDTEKNNFIFSALPVKTNQRRLVELIRRSITYSDLSEIYEYLDNKTRNDEELKDLFVETNFVDGKPTECKSQLSIKYMKNILEKLYNLMKMILRLSSLHDIYLLPRDIKEYQNYKMINYLDYLINIDDHNDKSLNAAFKVLKEVKGKLRNTNNRSLYFRELYSIKYNYHDISILQRAEAIISLCTNYAYEMSILNISKHYNTTDLTENPDKNSSFYHDFMLRYQEYWNDGYKSEYKFLQEENNDFVEFKDYKNVPRFKGTISLIDDVKSNNQDRLYRYEYELKNQNTLVMIKYLRRFIKLAFFLVIGIFMVLLVNISIDRINSVMGNMITFDIFEYAPLNYAIETTFYFAFGELITTLCARIIPGFMSLSDAIIGLVLVIINTFKVILHKNNAHISEYNADVSEELNQPSAISFSISKELKRYIEYYKEHNDKFKESSVYPIANINSDDVLKEINRDEEIYRNHYGVIYHSKYNNLIVDPIMDGKLYPYERVIPANDGAVIMLVRHHDKFILLDQYRHSTRSNILSIPRGFGEKGVSAIQNVTKELFEELNAKPSSNPLFLGEVIADSGLSSGRANVYLVDIDSYEFVSEEGIIGIIELSYNDLKEKINKGEIVDGFTLAAVALYDAICD